MSTAVVVLSVGAFFFGASADGLIREPRISFRASLVRIRRAVTEPSAGHAPPFLYHAGAVAVQAPPQTRRT